MILIHRFDIINNVCVQSLSQQFILASKHLKEQLQYTCRRD